MIKKLTARFKDSELAKKSLIVMVLKFAGTGLLFLLTIYLTNHFPPELVGQYDFSRSVLLILSGIGMLGAEQSIIYYAGFLRSKDAFQSFKSIYWKILRIIFISSLFIFLIFFSLNANWVNGLFDGKNVYPLFFQVSACLLFHSIMMLNIETFRSLNKTILSEVYRNILRYAFFFVGAAILFYGNWLELLVPVYLGCFVLLSIVSSIQVLMLFSKMKAESETLKFTYKEILKTSYPMALSTLTFFLMQSTDVILLGKFDVFENVAFYSTAIKISMLTSIALMSVNVITAPKISEEYSRGNHAALAEILKKSSRLIFMLSVPFLLFLILFSKFLLSLFGEEYQAAQIPLLVLLIGQFFNSLTGPTGTYMNMTGKQKILHRFLMGAFLVNFILNYTLIPLYGMTGSAIATSISVAGWNILAALFVYKKDSVKTFLS